MEEGLEAAGPGTVATEAAPPDPMVGMDFAELLGVLGIERHAEMLASQHICSVADLQLLTKEDCIELGLSIGERNRVVMNDWRGKREAEPELDEMMKKVARLSDAVKSLHG